jgi:nucleoside-diphosphate-sugar epimerase
VARALIVGCGCRGRELGRRLAGAGWRVRGTTRDPQNTLDIVEAGLEPAVADPDRAGSILDHIGDVTVVFWLLGSAVGEPEMVAAIHGPRLERVLEKLVDTPVRGFVYEAAGSVQRRHLEQGAGAVRDAAKRWRIPVELVGEGPGDPDAWAEAMLAAAERLTAAGRA